MLKQIKILKPINWKELIYLAPIFTPLAFKTYIYMDREQNKTKFERIPF